MRALLTGMVFCLVLLLSAACSWASDASLVVSEATLNSLAGKLGMISDSGSFQPYKGIFNEGFQVCEPIGFVDLETAQLAGGDFFGGIGNTYGNIDPLPLRYHEMRPTTGHEGGRIPPIGSGGEMIPPTTGPGGEIIPPIGSGGDVPPPIGSGGYILPPVDPVKERISPSDFYDDRIPLVMCVTYGGGLVILPLGEPVSWQWWVTGSHFTMQNNSMTFTATVRTMVNGVGDSTTRTVPATVGFDPPTNQVVVNLGPFSVPMHYERGGTTFTLATVDVAKLYTISVPIEPQTIELPPIQPGGASKTITGRVLTIPSTDYMQGSIKVNFDLGFTSQ